MLGSPCGPVHAAATKDMARQAYLMELHDSVHSQYTDGSLAFLGIASALDVIVLETIPEQNYPNPFVGETTLEFSVVKLAHVRLDVIDVLGCRVDTVVDRRFGRDTHQVCWTSESLPRSVYLARMEVDGRQAGVRKVVRLLRRQRRF